MVSCAVNFPANSLGTSLVRKVIACGPYIDVCAVKAVNKALHFRTKISYILQLFSMFPEPLPAQPSSRIQIFFIFFTSISAAVFHDKACKRNRGAFPFHNASDINENILWPSFNRINPPAVNVHEVNGISWPVIVFVFIIPDL